MNKRRFWARGIGVLCAGIVFLTARIAAAEMAIPVSVDKLLALSDRVFYGKVIDKGIDFGDCGHIVTDVTFQVLKPVKGNDVPGDTVLVTRFGVDGKDVPEEFQLRASRIHGPSWVQGENYLIFLGPEGECGYNNSVGIGAGVFKEIKDEAGNPVLVNAAENLLLFDGGSSQLTKNLSLTVKEDAAVRNTRGPVDRDAFLSLLSKMSGN